MKINIAIDGPSGAGKSTIADILASKLSYVHLDTGAMYRSAALLAIKNNVSLSDEEKIVELMENDFKLDMANDKVFLNGVDISDDIRTNEVSMAASDISKLSGVRKALVKSQQEIASKKGYIVDGRDICSVVLPDAEVKIFLTATSEDRAKRRLEQNRQKGIIDDYDKVLDDIKKRDYQDSHRANSPLVKAVDATLIDSSNMSIDDVVNEILKLVYKKIQGVKNDRWYYRDSWQT